VAAPFPPKDPTAVLDYALDWSLWLQTGETLSTATVTPSAGITVQGSPAPGISGTKVVWWMGGGTAGQTYVVTVTVTTSQGRTDTRSLTVFVEPR
jgi:hypothetical protein